MILVILCGHGHFDMAAYDAYLAGDLEDLDMPEADLEASLVRLPEAPATELTRSGDRHRVGASPSRTASGIEIFSPSPAVTKTCRSMLLAWAPTDASLTPSRRGSSVGRAHD